MIKVGVTGADGFIGKNLINFLTKIYRIPVVKITKDDFNKNILEKKISKCNVVIHLAGVNRNSNLDEIYNENIRITESLVKALQKADNVSHLIFSSSTQENSDNPYGKSKLDSKKILINWANYNKKNLTNLIIPNVFGPLCKPFYNSVISTFCFQLINNEEPKIILDNKIKLIYIDNLIFLIIKLIEKKFDKLRENYVEDISVSYDKEIHVSEILKRIKLINKQYIKENIFPKLDSKFDLNLFLTFFSYLNRDFFPRNFKNYIDERGSFSEVVKSTTGGQFSFSSTKRGITRGEHFHTRKIERFIVIKGLAEIKVRSINNRNIHKYYLNGDSPSYVDIPVWTTHNIKNTGKNDLITLFWINEHFNHDDPDTYNELVE